VQRLLSSEVGQRAAEGHIGSVNRWFAGTKHIDEIESLCVELLKKLFHSNYAEHRLVASMIGNLAVYAALTEPGDDDHVHPAAGRWPFEQQDRWSGRDSRLRIVDIPFDRSSSKSISTRSRPWPASIDPRSWRSARR
jgi:glycine hydroxymethyltransferase